jgi:hypothetical protein
VAAVPEQRPEPTPVELAGRTLEPNGSMLRFALSLRCVMLIASLGAALGALLMFWEGGSKMLGGVQSVLADHDTKIITAAVMGATDAFLFGIVLVIFAYSVAFGFVLDVSPGDRDALPMWMRAKGVAELKNTLVNPRLSRRRRDDGLLPKRWRSGLANPRQTADDRSHCGSFSVVRFEPLGVLMCLR